MIGIYYLAEKPRTLGVFLNNGLVYIKTSPNIQKYGCNKEQL